MKEMKWGRWEDSWDKGEWDGPYDEGNEKDEE
jgi:hypothetical protein